jgi:hypothetical protein
MFGPGYVLGVDRIQRMHHLDVEAGTVREEHCELGYQQGISSPSW